jgi:23S rRNA (cytidine1920-2'-O)/16S rRNA (cytidine1409-2'-O)-methyltransferase
MKRLDIYLTELKLSRSRSHATQLIKSGGVKLISPKGEVKLVDQPSFDMSAFADWKVEVEASPFLSRAGEKLRGALDRLQLNVKGWECADIGQSTGGFTDCLLKAGAQIVVVPTSGKTSCPRNFGIIPRYGISKNLTHVNCRNELVNCWR